MVTQKRKREESIQQEITEQKLSEKAIADRQEKFKNLNVRGALDKILKHLSNPIKFSKCLQLLLQLVNDQFDFLTGDDLFEAFDTVIKNSQKFKNETDRENVEKLYFKLVELSSVSEQMGEDYCVFSEA